MHQAICKQKGQTDVFFDSRTCADIARESCALRAQLLARYATLGAKRRNLRAFGKTRVSALVQEMMYEQRRLRALLDEHHTRREHANCCDGDDVEDDDDPPRDAWRYVAADIVGRDVQPSADVAAAAAALGVWPTALLGVLSAPVAAAVGLTPNCFAALVRRNTY